MAKIVWTEKASDHLQAIHVYIAHDSPVYAARLVRALVKSTAKIESMPLCGRIVPEFNDSNLREVIFQNYRIVYSVAYSQKTLPILAVIHGARDFTQAFLNEWEI
ncbi:MAG: type II toxin-antitoxin system RelE/ParE family toxin [Desulfuromonadales bacterium]|nr:type II toxin-antitoxin system RelE/ParE family toxin [Desulfuromonadales bacterium]